MAFGRDRYFGTSQERTQKIMSEYEYVALRAVDRPLSDKQLEFAECQSSHCEVTRRSFVVEYNNGSFRGDVDGLLRQGYDVFLRYTNYGDREIKLRLPHGLLFTKSDWSKYVDGDRLAWTKDSKGNGGILGLCPFHDGGELESVWDFEDYLDAAVQVRERLIGGDLRALYLLWLCAADDDNCDRSETIEPPVPHGLAKLPNGCADILPFFGNDPLLVRAAAAGIAAGPSGNSENDAKSEWLKSISDDRSRAILQRVIAEDAQALKAELLAEIRDSQVPIGWPCTDRKRTFQELLDGCDLLRAETDASDKRKAEAKAKREAIKAEVTRQARMKEMAKSPKAWLTKAEALADAKGTENYKAAADILADLREAVGGDEGDKITRIHAAHLAKKYPTLTHLKSSLRKRGLWS